MAPERHALSTPRTARWSASTARTRRRCPPRLTDWQVDHGGYTYAVGYLHPDDDTTRYRVVEAMIASVTWDQ